MSSSPSVVTLQPTIVQEGDALFLCVAVANLSKTKVVVVTLSRYLLVELKDDRGQFVRGEETDASFVMPSAKDYLTLPANSAEDDVFRLPISADMVGTVKFAELPRTNEVRVTYKADRVMPGLPRESRNDFYAGPTEPKSTEVQLP